MKKPLSAFQRIMRRSNYDLLQTFNGTHCLICTYAKDGSGYPHFQYNGKLVKAHRAVWEHHHGPIPKGLEIDHLCRHRSCIEDRHLQAVTHRANIRRGLTGYSLTSRMALIRGHARRHARARQPSHTIQTPEQTKFDLATSPETDNGHEPH